MQIVIEIPEEIYESVRYYNGLSYAIEDYLHEVEWAIKNGTPLPKGHGRIADMDEAIKCIRELEGEDAIWTIALIDWACGKRTIIEADKAESEEQT